MINTPPPFSGKKLGGHLILLFVTFNIIIMFHVHMEKGVFTCGFRSLLGEFGISETAVIVDFIKTGVL